MKSGKPQAFQEIALDLFAKAQKKPHLLLVQLQIHWPAVVGQKLARHTYPLRMQKGCLWIGAPDSCWTYELQFLKGELLASLEAYLEAPVINELRFSVASLPAVEAPGGEDPSVARSLAKIPSGQAPVPSANPGLVPGLVEASALCTEVESIGDQDLRAVFERSRNKKIQNRKQRAAMEPSQ